MAEKLSHPAAWHHSAVCSIELALVVDQSIQVRIGRTHTSLRFAGESKPMDPNGARTLLVAGGRIDRGFRRKGFGVGGDSVWVTEGVCRRGRGENAEEIAASGRDFGARAEHELQTQSGLLGRRRLSGKGLQEFADALPHSAGE